MTDRILDLSESFGHVSVHQGLFCLERKGEDKITIPFEEIIAVIGAHRQLTFTQAFFARLVEAGGVFVACDEKSRPVALMLPLEGHYLQTEQFLLQAQVAQPVKKRLWQAIIQSKIKAQARTLKEIRGRDYGLEAMAERVRSGDTANMEGQAARRYWQYIFEDEPDFRRDRDAEGKNALLNFGYTMLRAITARAICGAGLHPSLGINHHNRYNAFVLADDLMEPFRPVIDKAVACFEFEDPLKPRLDQKAKRALYEALYCTVSLNEEQRTLFDVLTRMCASIVQVYKGNRKNMILPD
jgi:CRISPR-associated protein Cas1